MPVLILVFWALMALVNIGLAIAIHDDARRIDTGGQTLGIHRYLWTAATLMGGVFAVGIYWVIYHSTLRRDS